MIVKLYKDQIMQQLRSISHDEVAMIEDADARYRVEAGSEKEQEINRCIDEAYDRLLGRCRRWLKSEYKTIVDNRLNLPASFNIELQLSERRAVGNAEALAGLMNAFMVEYALSKFYNIVHHPDMSNKHGLLALDAGKNLDEALYTKNPPLL